MRTHTLFAPSSIVAPAGRFFAWAALTVPCLKPVRRPPPAPPPLDVEARTAWLLSCSPWLLPQERQFVLDLAGQAQAPSARQVRRLSEIGQRVEAGDGGASP